MSVAVVAIAVGARALEHLVPPSEYAATKAQRLRQKDLAFLNKDGLQGCIAAETGEPGKAMNRRKKCNVVLYL
jgi:hypothetical protein